MTKRCLTAIAALALLTAALPAHAIVLSYQPKVGSVQRQKVSMAGRMETSVPGLEEAVRMEVTGETSYEQEALSATGELTRVETRLLGGRLVLRQQTPGTPEGEQQRHSVDMPTGRIVADMDRRGRVVKVVEKDLKGEYADQLMGAESANSLVQSPGLPEGDVAAGAVWSDNVTVPLGANAPEISLTLKSQLVSLETFQNRNCAKIRTTFSYPEQQGQSELAGRLDGALQADMVWYYDYEDSVFVYAEGTVGGTTSFEPGLIEGAITTNMIINVKVALVK